jgi:adenylate cyclase
MSFFQELKRRNVVRMGIAYAVVAWVLLQFIDFALDLIDAPGWILQVFVLVAAIGLPIVLIFSWVFELTPEGLKRESEIDRSQSITPQTGRKIDRIIIAALALAVVLLLVERFVSLPAAKMGPDTISAEGSNKGGVDKEIVSGPISAALSVAVLPFHAMSSGADDEYFADGLTEEILNSLAQLPELLVTARTSSFSFKGKDLPVQDIAAQLNVRHVVEGSVRRSGERLRVTAQLIRASDGFHLWSENYDSTEQDTIAVQEDIAEEIAQALDVVLDADKREAMRRSGLRDVPAFIAMQKANELYEQAHGEGNQIDLLRAANRYYEQVLERVPTYNAARRDHTDLYVHMLMNDATGGGQDIDAYTAEEVAAALPAARNDLEQIIAHAQDDNERFNAEFDLAFMNAEWSGMSARVERFLGQEGCDWPTWIDNIAIPLGFAERLLGSMESRVNCDPLSSSAWQALARTLVWAGKPEAALESARQGMNRAPGSWLAMQQTTALLAMGRFDEAEAAIDAQVLAPWWKSHNRMMIAAARVDDEAIETLHSEFIQARGEMGDRYFGLLYNAWLGRSEQANAMAAKVDQYVFGSQALITITLWCACGAPFDLASTPKFATHLKKLDMTWPPFSPVHFPLKEGVAQIRTTP